MATGRVGRRRLLLGGTGTLVAAAVGTAVHRATAGADVPAVAGTEWVVSAARGRSVRLAVVTPPGADRATLPVCLGLHGFGGDATWWSGPSMLRFLVAAWAETSPFAVVAVDGGNTYWHPRGRDDPMRMLIDEVPGWLTARGLSRAGGTVATVAGVSMGGAGALLYARERARRGRPVSGAAAMSPGLFTDWPTASTRPFTDEADWAAHDPLRFAAELAGTPLGVWCGDRDPFVGATRRFVDRARPEIAAVTPGGHGGAFYATALPGLLRFVADHGRSAPGA